MSSNSKSVKFDLLRMALTLFAISAVVAVALAAANYFTSPIIAQSAKDRLDQSLRVLIEDADTFVALEDFEQEIQIGNTMVPVAAVYEAKDQAGEKFGYCVQVMPSGYSNAIDMLVSIIDGAVSGVEILSISDTPGIGMKVESDRAFRESIYGITDPVSIVKTTPKGKNEAQVISGASISSSAYLNGVNAALEAVKAYEKEVG